MPRVGAVCGVIYSAAMRTVPAYVLTSVDRALSLITILHTEGSVSVTEVARRLDVAPSTAHRLLSMLVYRDFAVQGADRRYRAGTALSLPEHRALATGMLREVALPALEELSRRTRESANLFVRAGAFVHFVASWAGDQRFRVGTREGMTLPAHLTSGGLVLLSQLPDDEVRDVLTQAVWGEHDPQRPDPDAVIAELQRVRAAGFAFARSLSEEGVAALAVPVTVPGITPAAISLSLPAVRFDPRRVDRWVAELRRTAAQIIEGVAAASGVAQHPAADWAPSARLTEGSGAESAPDDGVGGPP